MKPIILILSFITTLFANLPHQISYNNGIDIKKRNTIVLKTSKQGYSQHMIAKVLGISQSAVYGVIKRGRK